MKMTKSIIDIFSRYEIKHSYFFIGENFILNESLNPEKDLPPVEIIVKRCFAGDFDEDNFEMVSANLETNNKYTKLFKGLEIETI